MSNREKTQKTIVVLGTQRSGTSVTAGILDILGVDLGNVRVADETNPTGYFEDIEFSKLIKEIFDLAGGNGYRPPSYEKILAQKEKVATKIKKLCFERTKRGQTWGWKVPGTNLTIELFLPYMTNPYFVTIFRNPLTNAESIIKRAKQRGDRQISNPEALKLINFYNREILNFFEKYPELPKIFIAYENILIDPIEEAKKLSEFIGLELTTEQEKEIKKFVKKPWQMNLRKDFIILKKLVSSKTPEFARKIIRKLPYKRFI